jgi:hypothetical protein
MTALRNTASSTWIDRKEGSDWAARIGDATRLVVDAMKAGLDAEYEYNKLTRHGVKPQDASATVLKRLGR